MSWESRLRESAYTSPSGKRITFLYEDVSKNFKKKTSSFDFADAKGTLIQDNGTTSDKFPMLCIFSGANHDLQSKEFIELLKETGAGRLEHPAYGQKRVIPFGNISQRDDLKTKANQSIIEVTFWETIAQVYPRGQLSQLSVVTQAIDSFNLNLALEFARVIETVTAIDSVSFKNSINSLLGDVSSALLEVAGVTPEAQAQFLAIYDSINNSIDNLIGDPELLATQSVQLVQVPSTSTDTPTNKITAYNDLLTSNINEVEPAQQSYNNVNSNEFHSKELFATSALTGVILSAINSTFTNKTQAQESASLILEQFDDIVNWRDSNYNSLGQTDIEQPYKALRECALLSAGYLVDLSFSLKQERTIVIDRNRTIIDLAGELYGEVDSKLDDLINNNNLSGDLILELPKGTSIVYYV